MTLAPGEGLFLCAPLHSVNTKAPRGMWMRRLNSSSLQMGKPRSSPARKPQGWMLPLGLLIQSHSLWPLPSMPRCPLAVPGATYGSRFRMESLGRPGPGSALQLDRRLRGRARPDPQVEACFSGLPTSCLPRSPSPAAPFLAWSWGVTGGWGVGYPGCCEESVCTG